MKTIEDEGRPDFLRLQRAQFRHDQRIHGDVACLPRNDRLKHYGLHYAKYVGRLARGDSEVTSVQRTVVDTALICLSAANTLQQRLAFGGGCALIPHAADALIGLADPAGRFADACEKIDHAEEFLSIALRANADVLVWVLRMSGRLSLKLEPEIERRRFELANRQFYIDD